MGLSLLLLVLDVYEDAVNEGIIDQRKYSFETFERDERNIFRDIYNEYQALKNTEMMSYTEWLVMNNFGILPDTKLSLFEGKTVERNNTDNKSMFMATVKKGDILITKRSSRGLIGHTAIMTTDYWVLEMPGGSGWANGIPDNNQQIGKDAWFDLHAADWTTVYRCPDRVAADWAAQWADHTYYSPTDGATKVKHITYKLTNDIVSINPSYNSKLVIHAYYFGTGSEQIVKELSAIKSPIAPVSIPSYFLSPFKLVNKGKY